MSRRNQSHRRRTYGRRQHEVRERQVDPRGAAGLPGDGQTDLDSDWQTADSLDDRAAYGDSLGGYAR